MILVTGGAGFIGSVIVRHLNEAGRRDLVVVDEMGRDQKWQNLAKAEFLQYVPRSDLTEWLRRHSPQLDAILHMGAVSATTETDVDILMRKNVDDSMQLFEYATVHRVPFVYASSAATYGDGKQGYRDDPDTLPSLRPLNPYGFSKKIFDQWAMAQKRTPPCWTGLKFFNVYGPNEYHKGDQASVVFHGFNQVRDHGRIRLFKSYRDGIADGEQKRDFIYVKDVARVIKHIIDAPEKITSGIYNLGTGQARSFRELAESTFKALDGKAAEIEWIDMPKGLDERYQYFTEATMDRFREACDWNEDFTSLETGVHDYVQSHLSQPDPYL